MHSFAMSMVGISPMREAPSDTSQMVNQALVGELLVVQHLEGAWVLVKKQIDQYEGWINLNELYFLTNNEAQSWDEISTSFSQYKSFTALSIDKTSALLIPPGAPCFLDQNDTYHYPFGAFHAYTPKSEVDTFSIIDTAKDLLGVPYLWGGNTDSGIDCSGYVQLVLRFHGYNTPRDASQQAILDTTPIHHVSEAKEGDLIFFDPDNKGKITHVGFYLGNGNVIHASGQVKISCMDKKLAKKSMYEYNKRYAISVCCRKSPELFDKFG